MRRNDPRRHKLSNVLLTGQIRFIIDRQKNLYKSFQYSVQESFPEATAATFPLAFACPLFLGDPPRPPEIFYVLPQCVIEATKKPGIAFLCDVIDFLSTTQNWSEKQVGELIRKVEDSLEVAGMDCHGRRESVVRRYALGRPG